MSKMSRRDFLRVVGAGSAAVTAGSYIPQFFVPNAAAAPASGLKVVQIFLSGGMDWFLTHERTGNSAFMSTFQQIRPTLSVPVAARLPLGASEFTVHNRLTEFASAYSANQLAVIMSAGVPVANSGSHEIATFHFARGIADGKSNEKSGWMQRLAKAYFNDSYQLADLRGGSSFTRTGEFGLPTDFRCFKTTDLARYGFNGTVNGESGFRLATGFATVAQAGVNPEQVAVQKSWGEIEGAVQQVAAARAATTPTLNPAFPNTSLGNQLRDAFIALVNFPTRMVFTSTGGFDLHADSDPAGQAVNTPAGQSRLLRDLNDAIAAFRANCIRVGNWNEIALCVVSEFGRTNRENGNKGLDHGDGSVAFVMGGGVRGGHYGVPVESADLLRTQNSVDAKVAIADVYADLTQKMGFDPAVVFPGFVRNSPGIML